jgi:hypothetical protein
MTICDNASYYVRFCDGGFSRLCKACLDEAMKSDRKVFSIVVL